MKKIVLVVAMTAVAGLAAFGFVKTKQWSRRIVANHRYCDARGEIARWHATLLESNENLRDDRTLAKIFDANVTQPICDQTLQAIEVWKPYSDWIAVRAPSAASSCEVTRCEAEPVPDWARDFDETFSEPFPPRPTLDPEVESRVRAEIERLRLLQPQVHEQLFQDTELLCKSVRDLDRSRKVVEYYQSHCDSCPKLTDFRRVQELARQHETLLRRNIELFIIKWSEDSSVRPKCLGEIKL